MRSAPTLSLVLAAVAVVSQAPAQVTSSPLCLPPAPVADGKPLAAALPPASNPRQRVAYAETLEKRAPAERWSLLAAASTLGEGVGPAFQLVRERIRFESYSGILRGAELCFAARAGNALDRSLVLIELLRARKIEARLVRGRLSRERAEALVESMFQKELAPAAPAPSGDLRGELPDRVAARARRDWAAVRAALGDTLPGAALPSRDELVREVEQHFWVEARQGKDWVDLDSAFADAAVGQSFAKVEQVYAKVPAELHQQVVVRVLTETIVDGKLEEKAVLEVKTHAEQIADEQVVLVHVPESGARGLGAAIAGRSPRWTPVLFVGSEQHDGTPIDFGLAQKGGIADALAAEPAAAKPSPFVAEVLEIEIVFPDGRSDVSRRALVDRAGQALRESGYIDIAKLAKIEADERGPIEAQAVHNLIFSTGKHDLFGYASSLAHYARCQLAASEAEQQQKLAGQPQQPASKPSGKPAGDSSADGGVDPLNALWPFYLQNLGWLCWSDHAVVPALNDIEGLRFYPDAPRVWIATLSVVGQDLQIVMDLRRDKLRAVARDAAASGRAAAERKLWFALVEGALEHEAIAERGASATQDEVTVATTSARLSAAGVAVLRAADVPAAKDLVAGDADKAAWLRLALQRGSLVVAPKDALRTGEAAWWEVHARGDARAVFGPDWNGARLAGYGRAKGGGQLPRGSATGGQGGRTGAGDYKAPKPTKPSGGGKTAPKGGGKGGGGGELGEYITVLMEVSVPSAYAYFAVGLGIEVTAMFVGAAIIAG